MVNWKKNENNQKEAEDWPIPRSSLKDASTINVLFVSFVQFFYTGGNTALNYIGEILNYSV